LKLFIPFPESFKTKEKLRLEKEKEKLEKILASSKMKLANEEFRSRAPKEVVEKLEESFNQSQNQLTDVQKKLDDLSS
jgi:valyl-tRNA synthetase